VSEPARGQRGAWGAFARAMGSTVLAMAMIGLAIARLGRVPRPTFEPVANIEGTRAVLGRVALVRRGEARGQHLGWSVLCSGREVVSLAGVERPTIARGDAGAVRVVRGDFQRSFDGERCR
jgi:hypothetical protein